MEKITIYTQNNCKQSEKLRNILNNSNIKYIEKDITYDVLQKREMIERSGGRSITPQIFIGTKHVESFEKLQDIMNNANNSNTAA